MNLYGNLVYEYRCNVIVFALNNDRRKSYTTALQKGNLHRKLKHIPKKKNINVRYINNYTVERNVYNTPYG